MSVGPAIRAEMGGGGVHGDNAVERRHPCRRGHEVVGSEGGVAADDAAVAAQFADLMRQGGGKLRRQRGRQGTVIIVRLVWGLPAVTRPMRGSRNPAPGHATSRIPLRRHEAPTAAPLTRGTQQMGQTHQGDMRVRLRHRLVRRDERDVRQMQGRQPPQGTRNLQRHPIGIGAKARHEAQEMDAVAEALLGMNSRCATRCPCQRGSAAKRAAS